MFKRHFYTKILCLDSIYLDFKEITGVSYDAIVSVVVAPINEEQSVEVGYPKRDFS